MTGDAVSPVVVVGGGVAGLCTAWRLRALGVSALVLEARDRVGGRTRTVSSGEVDADLGAAWYWPHHPRIAELAEQLGVPTFPQHEAGDALFESPTSVVRFRASTAAGARRFAGGAQRLSDRLAAELTGQVHCGVRVTRVERASTDPVLTITCADGRRLHARHLVLAVPPRVIVDTITFAPDLPAALVDTLRRTPTWMGGTAKIVLHYPRPFWRDAGLSGFAVSQRGPLGEVHDHTPITGTDGALMGFFAGAGAYAGGDALRLERVLAQLRRLFGEAAGTPLAVHEHAWWEDDTTSTAADRVPLLEHPGYGDPMLARGWWDETLWFAATETAPAQGGYLDGAIEAADRVVAQLQARGVTHDD